MTIDLQPFCATDLVGVLKCLRAPWRTDGKVIASDGRIMAIVDDMPGDFAAQDFAIAGRWRQLAAQFEAQLPDTAERVWHRLADLPVPSKIVVRPVSAPCRPVSAIWAGLIVCVWCIRREVRRPRRRNSSPNGCA